MSPGGERKHDPYLSQKIFTSAETGMMDSPEKGHRCQGERVFMEMCVRHARQMMLPGEGTRRSLDFPPHQPTTASNTWMEKNGPGTKLEFTLIVWVPTTQSGPEVLLSDTAQKGEALSWL